MHLLVPTVIFVLLSHHFTVPFTVINIHVPFGGGQHSNCTVHKNTVFPLYANTINECSTQCVQFLLVMSSTRYTNLISTVQALSICSTGVNHCIATLRCVQILQPLPLGFPLLYPASSPWKSLLVGSVQYVSQCDMKLVVIHGMLLQGLCNAIIAWKIF